MVIVRNSVEVVSEVILTCSFPISFDSNLIFVFLALWCLLRGAVFVILD